MCIKRAVTKNIKGAVSLGCKHKSLVIPDQVRYDEA